MKLYAIECTTYAIIFTIFDVDREKTTQFKAKFLSVTIRLDQGKYRAR